MSKDPSKNRYIEIPGEKKVVNTFKFDMNLPPPIPQPKTLYITFDPDRYIKPKLTLLTVKKKPTVLTDINLSINQLDVNTEPEKFNPEKGAKIEVPKGIKELLDEQSRPSSKKSSKQQPKKPTKMHRSETKLRKNASKNEKDGTNGQEESQQPAEIPKPKKLPLGEQIKNGFEEVQKYKEGCKHSFKEGVTCKESIDLMPDFQNIMSQLFTLKAEALVDNLKKNDNIVKFDQDIDKKPVLSLFMKKDLVPEDAPEEQKDEELKLAAEKVHNYEHTGNYVYAVPKTTDAAKEIVLNLNKEKKVAKVYQPKPLILKKKKVLFMSRTLVQEDDIEDEKKYDKKSIKFLHKQHSHQDYVNRKRKLEELNLDKTPYYTNLSESDYNQTQEVEELEIVKKRIIDFEDALIAERKRKEDLIREQNIAARQRQQDDEDDEDGAVNNDVTPYDDYIQNAQAEQEEEPVAGEDEEEEEQYDVGKINDEDENKEENKDEVAEEPKKDNIEPEEAKKVQEEKKVEDDNDSLDEMIEEFGDSDED